MKTIRIAIAICALDLLAFGQPNTGQTTYDHNGVPAILSSGTYATANAGFVMAGYVPTTTGMGYNFFIDKVDVDGNFNSSAGEFAEGYQMFTGGQNCNVSQNKELNCQGVSIINTSQGAMIYAIAASFDSGVLFAGLDNSGSPTTSAFYTYPSGATSPSKPVIAESVATAGDYYVCGSYVVGTTQYIYVMSINSSSGVNWSNEYDLACTIFEPSAVIEDPFVSPTSVLVVGTTNYAAGTDVDGFIMRLGNSGSPSVPTSLYLYDGGSTDNERLLSIAPAMNYGGFILGGSTDVAPTQGQAWMMRITGSGPINWSWRNQPAADNTGGDVIAVMERFNTYSTDEYYGLVTAPSNGGMIVIKLDDTGNWFNQNPNSIYSEFYYDANVANPCIPGAMSFVDASTVNDGIHVFGTADNTAPGDFVLVQACFNGACANCNNPNNQILGIPTASVTGPNNATSTNTNVINILSGGGLGTCNNWTFSNSTNAYTPSGICNLTGSWPSSPYSGNNARTFNITSLNNEKKAANKLSVLPNPSSGKLLLSLPIEGDELLSIKILNSLGQIILEMENVSLRSNSKSLELDLSSSGLGNGVYFLEVDTKNSHFSEKLIYTR